MVFQESFKQKSQKRPFLWNLTQDLSRSTIFGAKIFQNCLCFFRRDLAPLSLQNAKVQGPFFLLHVGSQFFGACGKSFPTQFFGGQGETIADLFFSKNAPAFDG